MLVDFVFPFSILGDIRIFAGSYSPTTAIQPAVIVSMSDVWVVVAVLLLEAPLYSSCLIWSGLLER
jgi:hypothetical protein